MINTTFRGKKKTTIVSVDPIIKSLNESRKLYWKTNKRKNKFMRKLKMQMYILGLKYPSHKDSIVRILRYAKDMDEIFCANAQVVEAFIKRIRKTVMHQEEIIKQTEEINMKTEETQQLIHKIEGYLSNRIHFHNIDKG